MRTSRNRSPRRISKANLRPGDLIFMYSDVHHVTIYVGNGWDVAAPTYGEPVQMQQPFERSRADQQLRPAAQLIVGGSGQGHPVHQVALF